MTPSESTVEWRRAKNLVPAIQAILPGFKWLKNGLRKSSVSASYVVSKDVKKTAAAHVISTEVIFSNYRAVMRKAEAQAYFDLFRHSMVGYLQGPRSGWAIIRVGRSLSIAGGH